MEKSGKQYSGKIAVVGISLQYAGCDNKEAFWKTLMNKGINSKPISSERLGTKKKELHHVNERPRYADTFCNDRYGTIDPTDPDLDNEHDLLLRLALDSLYDYHTKSPESSKKYLANLKQRCGIVSGCLSFPSDRLQGELLNLYQEHLQEVLPGIAGVDIMDPKLTNNAWTSSIHPDRDPDPKDKRFYMDPATFVADELGLNGIRYSMDAACASAIYVSKLAQDHLNAGHADIMLCGAVCFPEPFFILTGFSTFNAMPLMEGISMPLRKKSEGLTPGEGGAILVFKRLEDAIDDGDFIYGTLLGCMLNNAGEGLPLSPHQISQRQCLSDAYKNLGIEPHSVQYVECHATGTPLGDVSECEAMRSVFEGRVPRFGSTKGHFGHTLVAAGFAGMTKVILAMNNGVIPPTPGVDASTRVDQQVLIDAVDWPDVSDGRVKRAGLSAFGFGGTNAHAVFEEVPKSYNRALVSSTASPHKLLVKSSTKLAIVGMASHFGCLRTLDELEQAIYEGNDASCELPENRWRFLGGDDQFLREKLRREKHPRGCYVNDIEVDYGRLKTPLLKEDELLPQQLLAISTIDAAIIDSQLKPGGRIAVFVGLGTDLEIYRHRARVALREHLNDILHTDKQSESAIMDYVHDRG